jgi:hypothetical protein
MSQDGSLFIETISIIAWLSVETSLCRNADSRCRWRPKRLMVFASLLAEFDLQHVRHLGGGH